MSKLILPSDGIIISREWIEEKIKEAGKRNTGFEIAAWRAYKNVLESSQSLIPVLEVSFDEGISVGFNRGGNSAEGMNISLRPGEQTPKEIFINNPIEIE